MDATKWATVKLAFDFGDDYSTYVTTVPVFDNEKLADAIDEAKARALNSLARDAWSQTNQRSGLHLPG